MILNRATLLGLLSTLLLLLALLPSLFDVSNIPAILHSMQDGKLSPNNPHSGDTNEPTSGKHQGQLTDKTALLPKISRGDTGVSPVSKLRIQSLTQQSKTPRMNLTDLQKSDSGLPAENTLAKFNLQTIQQEVKKFIRRKILSRRKLANLNSAR